MLNKKFPHERAESRPECRSIECKRSESGSESESESKSECASESKSVSASESESGSENANELKLQGRDYE